MTLTLLPLPNASGIVRLSPGAGMTVRTEQVVAPRGSLQ
jgi:hypothetical protein